MGSIFDETNTRYKGPVQRRKHNCYAYAIDAASNGRVFSTVGHKLQPGEISGKSATGGRSTCSSLKKAVLMDGKARNVYEVKSGLCKKSHTPIELFVDTKGGDYHFYKHNQGILVRSKKYDTVQSLAKTYDVPMSKVFVRNKQKPSKTTPLPPKSLVFIKKNVWTHKRGLATDPLLKDACGKFIMSPEKACREYDGAYNYSKRCGRLCIGS
jgi:hypothetical protein